MRFLRKHRRVQLYSIEDLYHPTVETTPAPAANAIRKAPAPLIQKKPPIPPSSESGVSRSMTRSYAPNLFLAEILALVESGQLVLRMTDEAAEELVDRWKHGLSGKWYRSSR